jgi:hypothetical protein
MTNEQPRLALHDVDGHPAALPKTLTGTVPVCLWRWQERMSPAGSYPAGPGQDTLSLLPGPM